MATLEHCLALGGKERVRLQLLLETRGGRREELDVQVCCAMLSFACILMRCAAAIPVVTARPLPRQLIGTLTHGIQKYSLVLT